MPKLKQLKAPHREAIRLRYEGKTTEEIVEHLAAKQLNANPNTIKDWFKETGTLCETYKFYEQEMDEVHKETMDAIKKAGMRIREQNFRIANEMLVALMGSQTDNVKLAAVKEILDRVEGKPTEKAANNQKTPSYENIIRELEREQQEYKENEEKLAVGKSA